MVKKITAFKEGSIGRLQKVATKSNYKTVMHCMKIKKSYIYMKKKLGDAIEKHHLKRMPSILLTSLSNTSVIKLTDSSGNRAWANS